MAVHVHVRQEDLNAALNALDADITAQLISINSAIAGLDTRIDAIEATLAGVDFGAIDTMQDEIDALFAEVEDLGDAIDAETTARVAAISALNTSLRALIGIKAIGNIASGNTYTWTFGVSFATEPVISATVRSAASTASPFSVHVDSFVKTGPLYTGAVIKSYPGSRLPTHPRILNSI